MHDDPLALRADQRGTAGRGAASKRVWLFDLDNTLHDASHAAFGPTNLAMNEYMVQHLGLGLAEAARLRQHYWHRYGATLLGLVRHHGVQASHFLEQTHRHPGLEDRLRTSAHDRAALKRLRGRKYIVTNAPRHYTMRVLDTLKLTGCFDGVICIEDMTMFGQLRPKPDARMFRRLVARLKVRASDCVLVEDVLENQKAARRIGMRTAWMQRYLEGRFRGHLRGGANAGSNNGSRRLEVGVHPCPKPRYVCAKIKSLKQLLALR
ncbi:MAG: pyrimidine 5'-nucleotidase [Burkholderiales bacterium]|nr:pyrimidine 5'-nucleotidase [Burkholderiales bacterium]